MKRALCRTLLAASATLWIPSRALAQNPDLAVSFRPYLFVLLAFAAGWLLVGAWVFQIGKKVNQLSARIEEEVHDA